MNEKDELEIYRNNYLILKKHLIRLQYAFKRLPLPLSAENIADIINNDDRVMVSDQIAYRFSKFQDTLGKLLRAYLELKGEIIDHLSMIDIINMTQKTGIVIDKELWFRFRELRNILTHEYKEDKDEIAQALNFIADHLDLLEKILSQLKI